MNGVWIFMIVVFLVGIYNENHRPIKEVKMAPCFVEGKIRSIHFQDGETRITLDKDGVDDTEHPVICK